MNLISVENYYLKMKQLTRKGSPALKSPKKVIARSLALGIPKTTIQDDRK